MTTRLSWNTVNKVSLHSFRQVIIISRLIRVHQWIKNGLIFFPLIFSGQFLDMNSVRAVVVAAVCFSFLASSIYIINDLHDAPRDRRHPRKRHRPIAAGTVGARTALVLFYLLSSTGFLLAYFFLATSVVWLMLGYFLLNLWYSYNLKYLPPLDVIIVALFYLVRPVVGAAAIGVVATNWLIVTTFFAALYLVSLKRLSELRRKEEGGEETRKNIARYTPAMLESQSTMSLTMALVSYAIYSSTFPHFFVLTTVPLVAGALRVSMLQHQRKDFEVPERIIFTDGMLLVLFFLWLALVIALRWGVR